MSREFREEDEQFYNKTGIKREIDNLCYYYLLHYLQRRQKYLLK